ncbi:hypothetical protein BGZ65_008559, partial [Modicella reniformis]
GRNRVVRNDVGGGGGGGGADGSDGSAIVDNTSEMIRAWAKLEDEKTNKARKAKKNSYDDDAPSETTDDGKEMTSLGAGELMGSSGTTENKVLGFQWTVCADDEVGVHDYDYDHDHDHDDHDHDSAHDCVRAHVHIHVHVHVRNSTVAIEETLASAGGDDKESVDAMETAEEKGYCYCCCCCCGTFVAWMGDYLVVTDSRIPKTEAKARTTTLWRRWVRSWDSHCQSDPEHGCWMPEAPIAWVLLETDACGSGRAGTKTFRGEGGHDLNVGDEDDENHSENVPDNRCHCDAQSHDQHGCWS